jgi:calcyphosin
MKGKKTVQEAAREFMKQWDRHDNDGTVSYEEFEDYYKELSASIDGDDYFELMIRNAWRIPGGTGAAANTANKRVLVTNKDGSQSIQTIEQELGMKPGDKEDMRARLARQGVHAENIEMHGGVDTRTKASASKPPSVSLFDIIQNLYLITCILLFLNIESIRNTVVW